MNERPVPAEDVLEALNQLIMEGGGLTDEDRRKFERVRPLIDLGWQIRVARAKRGLTQKQLAELAGLPQPRIAEIESGGVNSTWRTITTVCKALGMESLAISPFAA